MIDINLMAEDFDAELNKVKEWNDEKRKDKFKYYKKIPDNPTEPVLIQLQERGAGENAFRLKAFLQELTALSDKYEIYIEGCGCCGSPWLNDLQAGKNYDNLTYGKDSYEVDV